MRHPERTPDRCDVEAQAGFTNPGLRCFGTAAFFGFAGADCLARRVCFGGFNWTTLSLGSGAGAAVRLAGARRAAGVGGAAADMVAAWRG
jgi:hypothetical protein